ncbi:unannotated protein [freshwater metagenome]|uniref:Unannotated protein n=1 Tax=freshwater metagenome TaxID=449393 RepID=A0A6J6K6F8_9ZZZZ
MSELTESFRVASLLSPDTVVAMLVVSASVSSASSRVALCGFSGLPAIASNQTLPTIPCEPTPTPRSSTVLDIGAIPD